MTLSPTRYTIPVVITAALSLVGAPVAGDEVARIPITDPELLTRWGFAPDAENVFMLEGALESTVRLDEESVADLDHGASSPNGYGTQDWSATSVGRADFIGEGGRTTNTILGGVSCRAPDTQLIAYAEVDLPTGVLWDGVRWWALDTDPDSGDDVHVSLWQSCWPINGDPPEHILLGEGQTTGTAPGYQVHFAAIPGGVTINNDECTYTLRLGFGDCHLGLQFSRGRVGWFRQLSPAPSVATFSDVPTTHLFFRHIEALAASGITGGCGGGRFCPGAPLTRGQMAAFLAEALGLHWPN